MLATGTKVEVRTEFDRSWAKGFAIEEALEDGSYLVRRRFDDTVLPVSFAPDDVRRERKDAMWWV